MKVLIDLEQHMPFQTGYMFTISCLFSVEMTQLNDFDMDNENSKNATNLGVSTAVNYFALQGIAPGVVLKKPSVQHIRRSLC